ncbi:MAG: excinuclease ABC subunit UvrC [Bacteroidota bacterium]|jgi:excinuclease ABC subunit C
MSISESIALKLKTLPDRPGVYQFLDNGGTIIYVGKAKSLKKRVSSYFAKNHDNAKTIILVRHIADMRYVVVDTELDALLLENNLIKKYQPKYNIQLKDDKTFPWICIKNEPFPRIFSTRRLVRDGSRYFGPYASVKVMNTLLNLIRELYPLRTCALDLQATKIADRKFKVCLEYHIGNCLGPCAGHQTTENYVEGIQQIEQLLKGNISSVIRFVKDRMLVHAGKHEYEAAQQMKEKLQLLERYQSRSTVVSPTIHEVDVCTLVDEENRIFFNYLSVHNGAIIHAYTAEVKKKLNESREEILSYILPEMRDRYNSNSKEVLTDEAVELQLEGVSFTVPIKGDKKQLVELSLRNATFYRLEKSKQEKIKDPEAHTNRILQKIREDFRLLELPVHMECFDNSNFHGTNAVSACVVFRDGKPSKKDYRHFNVKTVSGPDDFATMEEVVYRRYKRMLDEGSALPQLIIIDGGKGQLSAALNALEKLGLRGKVAICGIAKRLEEIYFPGDSLPIYLDKRSESLKVIQHMRNEAHRFGITHHRNKRSKTALTSWLDEVEGVGPQTKKALLEHFKTVNRILAADENELAKLVGSAKAAKIKIHQNK